MKMVTVTRTRANTVVLVPGVPREIEVHHAARPWEVFRVLGPFAVSVSIQTALQKLVG